MKTYYNYNVSGFGSSGGSMSGNADTLEGAVQEAVASAIYYKAHYPGAPIQYELIECCAVCHNEGTVARPKFKRVRCPECKGKCPTTVIGPISLKMPNEHNNIKLVVG